MKIPFPLQLKAIPLRLIEPKVIYVFSFPFPCLTHILRDTFARSRTSRRTHKKTFIGTQSFIPILNQHEPTTWPHTDTGEVL